MTEELKICESKNAATIIFTKCRTHDILNILNIWTVFKKCLVCHGFLMTYYKIFLISHKNQFIVEYVME